MTIAIFGGTANGVSITAVDANPTARVITPTTAVCSYSLESDGDIVMTVLTNSTVDVGDWITPKVGMSGYDARLHLNSGTNPTTGTMDTWLNLGTTRTWTLERSGLGTTSNNCTLEIRTTSGVVLKTLTITMNAIVEAA